MHRRVIDDRFELVERLGGGGMGLVWRAWDTALHREVALKEVRPPDPAMSEQDPATVRELRERVLREARALARLNHPHVVTIHHIVDEGPDAYPWLVMELVSGGSLQDRLARGPMAPAEAARLGREVLSALRAAHAVGIQHRAQPPRKRPSFARTATGTRSCPAPTARRGCLRSVVTRSSSSVGATPNRSWPTTRSSRILPRCGAQSCRGARPGRNVQPARPRPGDRARDCRARAALRDVSRWWT